MVDMFELLGKVVRAKRDDIELDISMDEVLEEIKNKLIGQVNILESDYQEIRKWYLDIQDCAKQDTKRWLLVSNGTLQILIGTEFLAYAYTIKIHDWKGGTLPVLCTSTTELKAPAPAVILKDWLDEQCWKESQKTS